MEKIKIKFGKSDKWIDSVFYGFFGSVTVLLATPFIFIVMIFLIVSLPFFGLSGYLKIDEEEKSVEEKKSDD